MSNLLKSKPETLTNKQRYLLTMSNQAQKMSDCEGQIVEIDAWALYEDEDSKTGEMKEILSILTADGDVLATISPTFKKDFWNMASAFGDDLQKIRIVSGLSKNGRKYITCEYAD